MSCCVPGCKTSYWNKESKGVSLFTALTDRQLRDWAEILRTKVGLEKFNKTDKICMLHFKDDVIEREKTCFVRGGKVYKEKRKIPILSDFADPSVFSEFSEFSENRKRKKSIDFCVINLRPEIVTQKIKSHNSISTKNTAVDEDERNNKKVETDENRESFVTDNKKLRSGTKRKLEINYKIDTEDLKSPKLLKKNNLYDDIVKAINKKEIISKHLNPLWITNINNNECISWVLWSKDYSKCLKRIILFKDLKVNVYINEESISLPEMNNIKGRLELENLLKTVQNIIPSAKVNDKKWWE